MHRSASRSVVPCLLAVLFLSYVSFRAQAASEAQDANSQKPASVEAKEAPFRFLGGEKIRLIVPKAIGDPIEQLVSDDGYIALPIGGAVNIRGKTIPEAQEVVTEALNKEGNSATRVFGAIAILEVPPRRVYVGGEVKLPRPSH